MKTYKTLKNQIAGIKTQNNLIDAHIKTCQAYSNYELSHEEFMELRQDMISKRAEHHIAWGQGI